MKQTKLSDEEIKLINDLRVTYTTITDKLGQLKVNQILIDAQVKRLATLEEEFTNEYLATRNKEEEFAQMINKKYGDGEVDLETGVFTSIKEDEASV